MVRLLRLVLKAFSAWRLLLLCCICLIGCNRGTYQPTDDSFRLPSKVSGTSDSAVITLQKDFKSRGIKVVTIGSDYLISIPSAMLFADQSPRIFWKSYGILNDVVFFLKQFRKVAVNVTSYSNKYVSVKREQALTLARARAVANYLWSQGIDSRFIFTEGAGGEKPIIAMPEGADHSVNSRIEITFRDAIV